MMLTIPVKKYITGLVERLHLNLRVDLENFENE
jgi:hypothetical protein